MGIQSVYEFCKKTLSPSGITPPSQLFQNLCSIMDTLTPADVGLKEENAVDDRWAQPITYFDVVQDSSFTMCIFCFPTSSVIPLHDHPEMTVFSKILYGSLHVKAYDWVEPPRIMAVKGPSSSQVLDVLTPPYAENLGRKCSYYHDYPYSSLSQGLPAPGDGKEEDYAWLAEINTPDDLYMDTGVYSGPVIQP